MVFTRTISGGKGRHWREAVCFGCGPLDRMCKLCNKACFEACNGVLQDIFRRLGAPLARGGLLRLRTSRGFRVTSSYSHTFPDGACATARTLGSRNIEVPESCFRSVEFCCVEGANLKRSDHSQFMVCSPAHFDLSRSLLSAVPLEPL